MSSSQQINTTGPQRLYEKMELQELNTRLADYMQRMHDARANNNMGSSASLLLESTRRLEDQLASVRNLYEQELDAVRKKADDLTREKANLSIEVNKCRSQSSELEQSTQELGETKDNDEKQETDTKDELAAEMDRQRSSMDQMNSLQRAIAQKDQELAELQLRAQAPAQQLVALQREYDAVLRDNQQLRHRYEGEQKQRVELDEKTQQLSQKLGFTEQRFDEEKKELNNRMLMASDTIVSLEAKLRSISNNDKNLAELVQRVKDAAAAELADYRTISENQFEDTLTQFRAQISENDRVIEELTDENALLRQQLNDTNAKFKTFEGQVRFQVNTLGSQKAALEEQLHKEREHSRQQMHMLEGKMRDLQEQLVLKLREVNTARDAQISLKAEIESYRVLLEDEENRLRQELNMSPVASGAVFQPSSMSVNMSSSTSQAVATSSRPMGPVRSIRSAPGDRAAYSNKDDLRLKQTERKDSLILEDVQDNTPTRPTITPDKQRAKSAGSRSGGSPSAGTHLIPTRMGQGRDYFDEMFKDLKIQGSITSPGIAPSPPAAPRPPLTRSTTAPIQQQQQGQQQSGYVDVIVPDRPASSATHDYTTHTASATGHVKILEVNPEGKYIRLLNNSNKKDEDLGTYLLQQNVGGHPVAVYRFPPRTRCAAGATVTVWAGGATDPIRHQPPADFVFKEQHKWGTGPECTTILCKPNGQAVAWMTSAHRFTPDLFQQNSSSSTNVQVNNNNEAQQQEFLEQSRREQDSAQSRREQDSAQSRREQDSALWFSTDPADNGFYPDEEEEDEGEDDEARPVSSQRPMTGGSEELTHLDMNLNGNKNDTVYLKREKQASPCLHQPKHPHGNTPPTPTHPHSAAHRAKTYGNDNSSVNRQTRGQSGRPDPVPGAPYAGASSQRMGSAMLRKFHQQTVVKSNGEVCNKPLPAKPTDFDGTVTSRPPSAFQKPRDRDRTGLEQIMSQHNITFQPPMPKPPLFSAW